MAASPHSWDFLLLRLRELRLPLSRDSASRTSGPTAKSIADILPRGGWQSKISCNASPPIRGDVQARLRKRSFAVFHAGEKRRCIGLNAGELFACGLDTALVVGRRPTLERSDVARKVFGAETHELHTRRLTTKLSDRRRKRPVGCKSREQILPNRSTAQRGGGSLQRLVRLHFLFGMASNSFRLSSIHLFIAFGDCMRSLILLMASR